MNIVPIAIRGPCNQNETFYRLCKHHLKDNKQKATILKQTREITCLFSPALDLEEVNHRQHNSRISTNTKNASASSIPHAAFPPPSPSSCSQNLFNNSGKLKRKLMFNSVSKFLKMMIIHSNGFNLFLSSTPAKRTINAPPNWNHFTAHLKLTKSEQALRHKQSKPIISRVTPILFQANMRFWMNKKSRNQKWNA
jgi:hypothetical protein